VYASRTPSPTLRALALAAGALALGALALGAVSCSDTSGHGVRVVASFYPLAWAAERVGGSRVSVEDLTPPGVDAHDTSLSARQRADLETADVVLILGRFGFQPEVERAVSDASGVVVEVANGLALTPSGQANLEFDPHVWLDPTLMERIVREVADGLVRADPAGRSGYRRREASVLRDLTALDGAYRSGLADCRFRTFVTTHEAFGYLAAEYGLTELGIEGLTPESEPAAARIQAAADAIRSGAAAPAVFFESTAEGRRVGESVAADVGVRALPLGTLESAPPSGDYLSVMRANLSSLQEGLQCPS
jgi:zinc transport system substrate-binding protein